MTATLSFSIDNRESIRAYDKLSSVYDALIPDPEGFNEFYLSACGDERREILYVGCGTGRLLERIARVGHHCLGVDPSEGSIRVARSRFDADRSGVDVRIDYLPKLGTVRGNYDLVLIAGGAFEYILSTRDQIVSLRRVREILRPFGTLVLDVSAPPFTTENVMGNYRGDLSQPPAGELGLEGSRVRLGYDHFRQIMRSTCTFTFSDDKEPLEIEYTTRYTTYSEWQLLLECSGFHGSIYGDFFYGPVTRYSSNFVIVAGRVE